MSDLSYGPTYTLTKCPSCASDYLFLKVDRGVYYIWKYEKHPVSFPPHWQLAMSADAELFCPDPNCQKDLIVITSTAALTANGDVVDVEEKLGILN